jgi:hypothetical protein
MTNGPNLYAYVRNGPINAFDAWGLEILFTTDRNLANIPGSIYQYLDPKSKLYGKILDESRYVGSQSDPITGDPAYVYGAPDSAKQFMVFIAPALPKVSPVQTHWGPRGFGGYYGGGADIGIGSISMGVQGQAGAGVFWGPDGYNSGVFAAGGLFARDSAGVVTSLPYTGQTSWTLGGVASSGFGGFITNGGSIEDLKGPFYQYNLTTPWFSVSVAYWRNDDGTITYVGSLTTGFPSFSVSGYSTKTIGFP